MIELSMLWLRFSLHALMNRLKYALIITTDDISNMRIVIKRNTARENGAWNSREWARFYRRGARA